MFLNLLFLSLYINFSRNVLDEATQCPKDQQCKLQAAIIINTSFCLEIPAALARQNVIIKFDVADDYLLTLEKKNKIIQEYNLLINTENSSELFSAYFTVFSKSGNTFFIMYAILQVQRLSWI